MARIATKPVKPTKPIKKNLFKVVPTESGQWRIFEHKDGTEYKEFRSDVEIFGMPLVSIVKGMNPETKKTGIAHGVIAIGPRAKGIVAIGQFCNGYVSVGQFATGRIAAIGQFTVAPLAIGQFAFGFAAIAQMGAAAIGLFQMGAVAEMGWGQAILVVSEFFARTIG